MPGNDSFVKFLLQSNTTDGSTTFVDSSAAPKTITQPAAVVTHSNWSPYLDATSTIKFPGTVDSFLQVASDADWNAGSGDFTLDFGMKPVSTSGFCVLVEDPGVWCVYRNGLGVGFEEYTYNQIRMYTGTISTSTYYHIAITRSGNTIRLFINGEIKVTFTYTNPLPYSGSPITIGAESVGANPYNGYLCDIRWSKGIARWTDRFNPWPRLYNTSPYSGTQGGLDGYTRLLVQSDTYIYCPVILDTSQTKVTIGYYFYTTLYHSNSTVVRGAKTSVITGGSGTVMTIGSGGEAWRLGTKDFTIDFNVYLTSYTSQIILSRGFYDNSGWYIRCLSGYLVFTDPVSGITMTSSVTLAAYWHHIAIVRSGSTFLMFIDGVQRATTTSSASIGYTNYPIYTGSEDGSNYVNGYFQSIRISVGVARWTSGFTPPTALYDTYGQMVLVGSGGAVGGGSATISYNPGGGIDSKTTILIQSETTNGSTTFTDRALGATVTAVATTHSTDFAKFGNTSIKFEQSGNRLSVPIGTSHDLAANDFTIDLWFRTDYATLDYQTLAWQGYWMLRLHSSGGIEFQDTSGSGVYLISSPSGAYTVGQWYHVAIVRFGTRFSMYVNGVLKQRLYDADSITRNTSYGLYFGANNGGINKFYGYMEEIRVSKIARWLRDSFTPPTGPYNQNVTYAGNGGGIGGGTGIRLVVYVEGDGGGVGGGAARIWTRLAEIDGGLVFRGDVAALVYECGQVNGGFPSLFGGIDTGWFVAGMFPALHGGIETIHTISVELEGGFPVLRGDVVLLNTFPSGISGCFPHIMGDVLTVASILAELSGRLVMFGDCEADCRNCLINGCFPSMRGDCQALVETVLVDEVVEFIAETRIASGGVAGPGIDEEVVFVRR